ncbi:DUF2461 domain-containing protein [Jannaschia aquimarina]|uniref:TIGR02453 family protein n=1 Tax=Jannaschia aquimarina TaxID=935700 RepID=A0A0D1EIG5_9RHOB|nr:DUF2461 domain-containing protein [Jannaschia aquimarina]KIT16711.1 hypothetical protein jaqu_14990 [Jannaschia aquimarina]SNS54449.1 TIGR02453 family protein [Jannaschia aquimarina]
MSDDGFTKMLDRAQRFYAALAQNNSRDWFEPRKAAWKRDIEAPAKLFADLVAEDLARLTRTPHRPKVFRINRDIRFSKDKSPYKTMLAMLWAPVDPGPSFYFGIEPAATFAGLGWPGFDKDGLARFRALIDRHGDDLTEAMGASGGSLSEIGPDPLKRVPKPYAPEHPHGDLLRRKSFALGGPLPEGWRETGDGLVAALTDRFEALLPVREVLIRDS